MNEELEERFVDIAEDIISRAESVECSLEDFYRGLQVVMSTLNNRLAMAEEEGINL